MSWAAVAGAAVGVVGSAIASSGADDAASAQAGASQDAIGEQRRQFDLTRADYAPYREAGANALGQFAQLANTQTSAADAWNDPGYQFGMQQGQQAVDRKIAAQGGRVSGAAIKAASRFNNQYATTAYTAADQRRNDRLNRLAALAGIGQTSTGASAAAGTNAANQISGLISSQGDATAASRMAQGNIWGNTANSIAALYGRGQNTGSAPPSSPFANYGGDYNSLDYRP